MSLSLRCLPRKLVQYGVMKGLLRRLHKYPIDLKRSPESIARGKPVARYFDGAHSYDDICAKTGERPRVAAFGGTDNQACVVPAKLIILLHCQEWRTLEASLPF